MKRTHTTAALAVVALLGTGVLAAGTVLAHGTQGEAQNGTATTAAMMGEQGPSQGMPPQGMMDGARQGMGGPAMMRIQNMMAFMMGGRDGHDGHDGGCDRGPLGKLTTPLTVKDVTAQLEKRLEWRGNKRLKVGKVEMTKDKNIVAEIVTVDGSLVRKILVDPTTGMRRPID